MLFNLSIKVDTFLVFENLVQIPQLKNGSPQKFISS